jgi:hypothetical protein
MWSWDKPAAQPGIAAEIVYRGSGDPWFGDPASGKVEAWTDPNWPISCVAAASN